MDKHEFEQIYQKLYQSLYLYALSLTHHPQDAEDLVMETLVKAYLSYGGVGNIQAWMFKVLKNTFIDLFRKNKRIVQVETDFLERLADSGPTFSQKMQDEEKKLWLYQKIYTLPEREREVILLTLTSGLDDEEIAEMTGISIGNLRVIRHRAKTKLRKMAESEVQNESG